jgi:cytochrome c
MIAMKLLLSQRFFHIILATLLGCCFVAQSFAATPKTQSIQKDIADLKSFVESGLKYIKDNGETKAYQEFNNPKGKFRNGNLYLFVIGFDGKVLAEGGNPKDFVGKNLFGAKDKFGTPYFQLFVGVAKRGGGVVGYYWQRPDTGVLQYKSSYIAPLNKKAFIGAGVYKSLEVVVSQETKIKKLKKFVESAVEYYKQKGAQKAYKEFNNPKGQFVKGDLYVFVDRYNGETLAHGGDPKHMMGVDITNIKDEFGTPLLMMFTEAAKSGGGLVSYYWPRYTQGGAVRFKTTYVAPLDKEIYIAAGYYED